MKTVTDFFFNTFWGRAIALLPGIPLVLSIILVAFGLIGSFISWDISRLMLVLDNDTVWFIVRLVSLMSYVIFGLVINATITSEENGRWI